MSTLAVIPCASRRSASRQAAARAVGKPMVQHVWERARAARGIDELVIATDDERIVPRDAVSARRSR
jgi:3-deoxy-manno-octulosonate cytidylyltransferase (CMP-KDO synthetase)